MKASRHAAKRRRRSDAQQGASTGQERDPVSLDIDLFLQAASLAGQAANPVSL